MSDTDRYYGVGMIGEVNEVYRLAAGRLIPFYGPPVLLESTANGFDVHAVLNTIGSAVEDELEWRWPPPYDGPMRRAMLPLPPPRSEMQAWVRDVLVPLTDATLHPWQERRYIAGSGEPLRVYKGRRP